MGDQPGPEDQNPPIQVFTTMLGVQLDRTLAQQLVPTVDRIRDLNTMFGIRPYEVRRVRTQWAGGKRGVGVETVLDVVPILPTPKLVTMDGVDEIVQAVGTDEFGEVRVEEISGRFEEDFFFGRDMLGDTLDPSVSIYYEIEFPRLDGRAAEKRRFFLTGTPNYIADEVQWTISLRRAREDRSRTGFPRP